MSFLLPVLPKMDPNFCQALLVEFLAVCSVGDTATPTFSTTNGLTNTNFNVNHGHPRCPPFIPPWSPRCLLTLLPCSPPTLATLEHQVPPTLTILMPKPLHQEEGQRSRQNYVA